MNVCGRFKKGEKRVESLTESSLSEFIPFAPSKASSFLFLSLLWEHGRDLGLERGVGSVYIAGYSRKKTEGADLPLFRLLR